MKLIAALEVVDDPSRVKYLNTMLHWGVEVPLKRLAIFQGRMYHEALLRGGSGVV